MPLGPNDIDLTGKTLTGGTITGTDISGAVGGAGVSDGDKGDVNVTSTGATWTVQSLNGGTTPSANGLSLVSAANYAAMRGLLDLEGGTDFYSISAADAAFQPKDADLTTWAGLTPSANAQSLVTAANYAAMRALLDLEAGTDFYSISAADAAFQAKDSDLTALASPGTLTAEAAPASGDLLLGYVDGGYKSINWSLLPGAGGGISDVVITIYSTGSGTHTWDANVVRAEVWVTGQGGGGGGADNGDTSANASGGGGGAGGTAYADWDTTEMGANAAYAVGTAAGGGGANTGGTGTTGTDSTLNPAGTGATLTGSGGVGGIGFTTSANNVVVLLAGGAGGAASSGDINMPGQAGSFGMTSAATANGQIGGNGGSSIWGGGGANTYLAASGSGANNAVAPGSGGGGAVCINTVAGQVGGNGAAGLIVIKEYVT